MHQRPDLIVPIKDRRQHKRYLTLKNAALGFAAALVAFLAISIYSEVRRPAPNDYGRLAKRAIPAAPAKPKSIDVVHEEAPAPIADQTPVVPYVAPLPPVRNDVIPPSPSAGNGVAIVQGTDGVTIVQKKTQKRVLAGGFGRE